MDLPCPNDRLDDRIVIASVWGNDLPEYGPVFGTVILLNPQAPFYTVCQVEDRNGEWNLIEGEPRDHMNINFAVEDFANSGGDV